MTSSVKGLFWDVDGTLVDSTELCLTATNAILLKNNASEISLDQYHEGVRFPTPQRMAWHFSGNPDDVMGSKLGAEFDEYYIKLISLQTTPLIEGIRELILTIHNKYPHIVFGAISNACSEYVRVVLKVHQLDHLFVIQLGADDAPAPKPSPKGLLFAAEQVNIEPNQCVYIGDSPGDGKAGRSAGMKSIGVTWGSYSIDQITSNCDIVFTKASDLSKYLEDLISQ